ncbi:MAG TPA: FMN-binding protein [Clostridiaceae bacterium]|nr:FMN-binding protein [Clostridiaceae bacterium]
MEKKGNKKIKRILILSAILLFVIVAVVFFLMSQQINKYAEQDFTMVNISDIPNGVYEGSASALLVTAQVEVTVRDGRILRVNLPEHSHGPGYGAEAICDSIVKNNSPDVDSISGATASSVIIKTAVLEALISGETP